MAAAPRQPVTGAEASTSHCPADHRAQKGPVFGLDLSLVDPVTEPTESVEHDLDLLQRRAITHGQLEFLEHPLSLCAPVVSPVRCHGALIADPRSDGKLQKM